jgi:EmrB/QacA subfamily drug resistance transporter
MRTRSMDSRTRVVALEQCDAETREFTLVDEKTKRSVLLVATLSGLVTPFMASSVNVALPQIQDEFHIDAIMLAWIQTSYLLATAMFLVPLGKLADIYGRRVIFSYGMSVFTIASCLSAASLNLYMLLAARVLQGIGASMIFGTGIAMIAAVFPPGERGRAIGLNVTAVYIGLSTGPFVGGLLTQYLSWRAVFAVVAPMGILTVLVCVLRLRWTRSDRVKEAVDIRGSFLYAASILLFMLGLSTVPAMKGFALIVGGVAFFAMFTRWELKVPFPVLNLELFRTNRGFTLSSAAALINYSATFAVTFLLSLYLQYIKGLAPTKTGMVLMIQPLTMAILSPLAGALSDRIEPQKIASTGMALTATGLLFMTVLGETSPISWVLLDLILLGLGFALFSSPNMNAIMTSVEQRFYGLAAGVVGSMRLLGQTMSMGIASVMFALYIGPVKITAEVHPLFLECFKTSFLVFGCICLIGIPASLARGKIIRK